MSFTKIKLGLLTFLLSTGAVQADERDDINQVLKEIHYTKEVVLQLRKVHNKVVDGRCRKVKICFYYDGLLEQLTVAEVRIKEYLNGEIQALHTKPKRPIGSPLYRVRKN